MGSANAFTSLGRDGLASAISSVNIGVLSRFDSAFRIVCAVCEYVRDLSLCALVSEARSWSILAWLFGSDKMPYRCGRRCVRDLVNLSSSG